MFICQTCGVITLSEFDRDEHEIRAGHSRFIIHDMEVGKTRTENGVEIDL
jgi:hypothetical protein